MRSQLFFRLFLLAAGLFFFGCFSGETNQPVTGVEPVGSWSFQVQENKHLYFEMEASIGNIDFTLFDMVGNPVEVVTQHPSSQGYSVEHLQEGVYFLQLNEPESEVRRILIQRDQISDWRIPKA